MLSFIPFGTRPITTLTPLDFKPGRLMRILAFSAVIDNAAATAALINLTWMTPGMPSLFSPDVSVPATTLARILWIPNCTPTALVADDVMLQQLIFEEIQENQTLRLSTIGDVLLTDPMLVEVVNDYPHFRYQ